MIKTKTLRPLVLAVSAVLAPLAGCQTAPTAAPPSISIHDVKTLPPAALQDKLIAQLDALLTPTPPPPRDRRFANRIGQFGNTWLITPPRLDENHTMCTYDVLDINLRPDVMPDDDPTEHTPAHAVGLEASRWFAPLPAGVTDCTGVTRDNTWYFETDQWLYAEQDYAMLKGALARLNTPAADFAVTCDEYVDCAKVPYKAKAETLWDISECRGVALPAGAYCRHFSWREPEYVEMNIIFNRPGLDRKILTVNFEPSIIV